MLLKIYQINFVKPANKMQSYINKEWLTEYIMIEKNFL